MKTILWDFDGVILDSMEVRDFGFKEIFKSFDKDQVNQFIDYHRVNGGLSRYVKIRYFFETIIQTPITEHQANMYAIKFSNIMRKELTDPKNLIDDSVEFIKKNHSKYNFHIVSGSDQEELRFLCRELRLVPYFISIHGSPTAKNILVEQLLSSCGYLNNETCLIGDSINDFDAALANGIAFYGYNNGQLKNKGNYIDTFTNFHL